MHLLCLYLSGYVLQYVSTPPIMFTKEQIILGIIVLENIRAGKYDRYAW
jgi:hypothetical protein